MTPPQHRASITGAALAFGIALGGCGTDPTSPPLDAGDAPAGPASAAPSATATPALGAPAVPLGPVVPPADATADAAADAAAEAARVAAMTVEEFRTSLANAPGESRRAQLIKWGESADLAARTWTALWTELNRGDAATSPARAAILTEAERFVRDVAVATGRTAYTTQLADHRQVAGVVADPEGAVAALIADARKALGHFNRPEAARAKLARARAIATQAGLSTESSTIAELEATLPAPKAK